MEAWLAYRALCGRTVSDLSLHGMVLEWCAEGFTAEEKLGLVKRLDSILDVLQPRDDTRESHGGRQEPSH